MERESIIMEYAGSVSGSEAKAIAEQTAREAILSRDLSVRAIDSVWVEHKVEVVGCCFAGVIQI
ncbi:hypothetical protein [Bradyrhizobium valentinum]|uniref:hypothetical protein n=1 Tax=Bradyrhizobium valentinum TaxID=1518501 RepID=UPI003B846A3B